MLRGAVAISYPAHPVMAERLASSIVTTIAVNRLIEGNGVARSIDD
jgi:hypothetical protein